MSAVEPVVHAAEWDLGPYLPLCDRGGACVGCGAQRDLSVPHADGCYALAMMIELSALRAWKREALPVLAQYLSLCEYVDAEVGESEYENAFRDEALRLLGRES